MIVNNPKDPNLIESVKASRPVGIPTETVYGLAAKINDPTALKRIFELKERPLFDPLIVHVNSREMARNCAENWCEIHDELFKKFSPGPLTLVMKKRSDRVSDLITSGFDTVALRIPAHEKTLSFIESIDCPIAAPSANPFKKTSPTEADHVNIYFKEKVVVLDGGPCKVGIESSIFRIDSENQKINILRKGVINPEEIKKFIKIKFQKDFSIIDQTTEMENRSPGLFKSHYQPDIPLTFVKNIETKYEIGKASKSIEIPRDPLIAIRTLYSDLKSVDQSYTEIVMIPFSSVTELINGNDGFLWDAYFDRLTKAASKII